MIVFLTFLSATIKNSESVLNATFCSENFKSEASNMSSMMTGELEE